MENDDKDPATAPGFLMPAHSQKRPAARKGGKMLFVVEIIRPEK